jgi:predicted small secreted protein
MKRILLVTLFAVQAFAMSGCSTVDGMGQDISDTWHSVVGDGESR